MSTFSTLTLTRSALQILSTLKQQKPCPDFPRNLYSSTSATLQDHLQKQRQKKLKLLHYKYYSVSHNITCKAEWSKIFWWHFIKCNLIYKTSKHIFLFILGYKISFFNFWLLFSKWKTIAYCKYFLIQLIRTILNWGFFRHFPEPVQVFKNCHFCS